jgi:predicted deacylase
LGGILRLLARLDMIDKNLAPPAPADCYYFRDHKKILTRAAGFVRYDVKMGADFKKGDTLFTLHPSRDLGEELPEIASEDGVMYKHAPTHIYRLGDETLHYVPKEWLVKL